MRGCIARFGDSETALVLHVGALQERFHSLEIPHGLQAHFNVSGAPVALAAGIENQIVKLDRIGVVCIPDKTDVSVHLLDGMQIVLTEDIRYAIDGWWAPVNPLRLRLAQTSITSSLKSA